MGDWCCRETDDVMMWPLGDEHSTQFATPHGSAEQAASGM